ncbi:hypothetical protein [Streptomyces sp. NPDC058297]
MRAQVVLHAARGHSNVCTAREAIHDLDRITGSAQQPAKPH